MAVEALGKLSDIPSLWMFQTYCMLCNGFINGAKERTCALSVTIILRSSLEKELFRFESTGASGLPEVIGKSGKEAEKRCKARI